MVQIQGQAVPTLAASHAYNPGGTTYNSSGNNDGSGLTQDWYIHTQSVDAAYVRVNDYNYSVSTPTVVPAVTNSHIEFTYTVHTSDEIILNGNFNGDLVVLQKLELMTNADASVGFGTQGVVNTSAVGYLRRAVLEDENGIITDPEGTCTKTNVINLDLTPGTFDESFDSSANITGVLGQLVGQLPSDCETFSIHLVDL